ncbi:hypothetical protein APHAL10511_004507 [Amanita phalloides]|nr:hypothetical protein APHAL10511_004507 [Amanita phalloides]
MSEAQFNKAVKIVQSLPKDGPVKTSPDDQLLFYKYYKQVTIGNVNTPTPGIFDLMGKAKWNAWKSVEGKTTEECHKAYVDKLIELLKSAGDPDSLKQAEEIENA